MEQKKRKSSATSRIDPNRICPLPAKERKQEECAKSPVVSETDCLCDCCSDYSWRPDTDVHQAKTGIGGEGTRKS